MPSAEETDAGKEAAKRWCRYVIMLILTRGALGRAHLPPTKVFGRLSQWIKPF